MDKRTPNYKLVILILLVATGVTYWARTRPPIVLKGADLASLPTHLGEWVKDGHDWTPGKDVLEGWYVGASDFLTRTYTNPAGTRISLMVVYKGQDRRGWHLSEMCFTGSGFNVEQSQTEVPYVGRTAHAVKLVAVDPETDTREIVVYLFAQARRTESSFVKQQMSMALSRLRPSKYGWAFIRVTTPVTISEADTMKQIRGFFEAASGPLLKVLTEPDSASARAD